MTDPIYWTEEDGEEVLWICPYCDTELHADCVGDTCPECGADADDNETVEQSTG